MMRHRKGGPLAATDANLLLGRLILEYFPKIFGKNENEPLEVHGRVPKEFENLAQNINANSANEFTLDEIIYGCVSRSTRHPISECT